MANDGYQFTDQSAKRIADAVRKIEGLPPKNDSGGGMSQGTPYHCKLWYRILGNSGGGAYTLRKQTWSPSSHQMVDVTDDHDLEYNVNVIGREVQGDDTGTVGTLCEGWKTWVNGEWVTIVRLISTVDVGEMYLGIVKSPGANGTISSNYVVNVYGADLDSLSEDPTSEDANAVQNPASAAYYWGELVGVQQIGGQWRIQKFLSLPMAYEVEAQQVCLRLNAPGTTGSPTNFLIDLHDCLTYLDGGANANPAYVPFSFGDYGGMGYIGKQFSVPVPYQAGWNLAGNLSFYSTVAEAVPALILGGPTTLSDSQDSLTGFGSNPLTSLSSSWTATANTYAPDAYRFPLSGSNKYITYLNATVYYYTFGGSAGTYPTLLALPNIYLGVDSSTILLGYFRATISWPYYYSSSSAPNKVCPGIQGDKPLAAGGATAAGAYNQNMVYSDSSSHPTDLTVS